MKYLAITAILCLVLAGASFAGNVTMTEVITGGNLTLTMPSNFSMNTIIIGGYAELDEGPTNVDYYVEDSRGTGVGWNVGFQISQFATSGTPQRTLPVNVFRMTNCDEDHVTKIYGQTVYHLNGGPDGNLESTNVQNIEVKGITAAAGYGMGKYMITSHHSLNILANVYAGTYTATLTATLNNVP